LKISYIKNEAPIITGDITGNKVEVREDDDNNNQIEEFSLNFRD